MKGGMPLARDVVHLSDRWNEPSQRSTGLPEVRSFETERTADGHLRRVRVKVELPITDKHDCNRRPWVAFRVEGGSATPRTVDGRSDSLSLQTQLTAVLAATSALNELPGVQAVKTVADVAAEIADREPRNGRLRTPEDPTPGDGESRDGEGGDREQFKRVVEAEEAMLDE